MTADTMKPPPTYNEETGGDSASRHAMAEPRTPPACRDASHGRGEPTTGIQAFDNRRQYIVGPDEIRPGDWLRDLGTLRQIASVEEQSATGSERIRVVRFESTPDVEDLALTIPDAVTVTIWRATYEPTAPISTRGADATSDTT